MIKDKKQFRNIALALGLAIIIIAGLIIDSHKTLYHFREVEPGKIYRSGTLSKRGLDRVKKLTGLKTIVNLRAEREYTDGEWYERERSFALRNNVQLVDIAMEPDTPPSEQQIEEFIRLTTTPENLPVLIHCAQGVIRTGMMVAVYEIAVMNQDNDKVLSKLEWFGHKLDKRPKVRDFILNFHPKEKIAA